MPLCVSGKDLGEAQTTIPPRDGELRIRAVFGPEHGLAVVERGPGYRSQPRVHDAEQLVCVVGGETWFYVEDKGYHLRRGDFLRIPRMAVHWERNPSVAPCTTVYGNCPVLDPFTRRGSVGLFSEREDATLRGAARSIPVSDEYTEIEGRIGSPERHGLYRAAADVPELQQTVQGQRGAVSNQLVYGHELGLLAGIRPGGYRWRPHFHDCEQINYLADGEMWMFVEDEGFHLRAGDFLRVPRMAVHWAWNRSDRACLTYETHAPPLEPRTVRGAVGLFEDGESLHPPRAARGIYAPDRSAAVEAKYR
jgi:quercetin dioxygenase-like cupin family protein